MADDALLVGRAGRGRDGPGRPRPPVQEATRSRLTDMERLEAPDLAEAIGYRVARPRLMAVNEVLVRLTEQDQ